MATKKQHPPILSDDNVEFEVGQIVYITSEYHEYYRKTTTVTPVLVTEVNVGPQRKVRFLGKGNMEFVHCPTKDNRRRLYFVKWETVLKYKIDSLKLREKNCKEEIKRNKHKIRHAKRAITNMQKEIPKFKAMIEKQKKEKPPKTNFPKNALPK